MSPRRRALDASQIHVPISMIDVFSLSLMALMFARPQPVDIVRLPTLKPTDAPPSAATGANPVDVTITPEGAIRLGDTECEIEEVPRRILAEPDENRPIRLLVHLDDQNRGGVETVVRLQMALGRADLMSRVFLATQRPAASTVP
jgi:biopolymer transport protein ExbD